MSLRPIAILATALLAAGGAAPASWRPVPGAPDVEVDVASFQQERTRVAAWLRWPGRSALVPALVAQGVSARVHRTAVLTEFDCGRRTLRPLAAQAWDGAGTPVFMASVPGPVRAVEGQELQWAYEAVCEAARAAGRF